MTSRRLPRGITRTSTGYRLTVRVHDRLWQKRYPASTPLDVLETKLKEAQKKHRAGRATQGPSGTLGADIATYLTAYFGDRPGRAERERHLTLWKVALGAETWRVQITREDVSRVLQGWRSAGLGAETCNKRRTALLALYNALDGKGGENPVRAVPKFRVQAPLPRALPYPLIEKALKKLPKCRTRARLKLMAYTGIRPVQLRSLTPEDWDDKKHTLLLRSTDKGRGTRPHRVPLSPEAQAALREFEDTDAWGSFTTAPMGRMWKAAIAKVKGLSPDAVPYDLRHSFGTQVYRSTGDVRVTKELLGHASIAMTERYTLAAIPERQTAAVGLAFPGKRKKGR